MGKYNYSELENYFKDVVSLSECKENLCVSASLLAMLPFMEDQEEICAHVHEIAGCLYEYAELLKRIKVKCDGNKLGK